MSAQGAFIVTELFEAEVAKYTGAPYAIAVNSCTSALFLALTKYGPGNYIDIPCRTFMSLPCTIIQTGNFVQWSRVLGNAIKGAYQLGDTNIWDCALRFTAGMYRKGQTQCLSFTGPYKTLKLGVGGMILTDDKEAAEWYKKARNSGRSECNYHDDNFTMLGWKFYMPVQIAAQGLLLISQFYKNGKPIDNPDIEMSYPDLSQFKIYQQ